MSCTRPDFKRVSNSYAVQSRYFSKLARFRYENRIIGPHLSLREFVEAGYARSSGCSTYAPVHVCATLPGCGPERLGHFTTSAVVGWHEKLKNEIEEFFGVRCDHIEHGGKLLRTYRSPFDLRADPASGFAEPRLVLVGIARPAPGAYVQTGAGVIAWPIYKRRVVERICSTLPRTLCEVAANAGPDTLPCEAARCFLRSGKQMRPWARDCVRDPALAISYNDQNAIAGTSDTMWMGAELTQHSVDSANARTALAAFDAAHKITSDDVSRMADKVAVECLAALQPHFDRLMYNTKCPPDRVAMESTLRTHFGEITRDNAFVLSEDRCGCSAAAAGRRLEAAGKRNAKGARAEAAADAARVGGELPPLVPIGSAAEDALCFTKACKEKRSAARDCTGKLVEAKQTLSELRQAKREQHVERVRGQQQSATTSVQGELPPLVPIGTAVEDELCITSKCRKQRRACAELKKTNDAIEQIAGPEARIEGELPPLVPIGSAVDALSPHMTQARHDAHPSVVAERAHAAKQWRRAHEKALKECSGRRSCDVAEIEAATLRHYNATRIQGQSPLDAIPAEYATWRSTASVGSETAMPPLVPIGSALSDESGRAGTNKRNTERHAAHVSAREAEQARRNAERRAPTASAMQAPQPVPPSHHSHYTTASYTEPYVSSYVAPYVAPAPAVAVVGAEAAVAAPSIANFTDALRKYTASRSFDNLVVLAPSDDVFTARHKAEFAAMSAGDFSRAMSHYVAPDPETIASEATPVTLVTHANAKHQITFDHKVTTLQNPDILGRYLMGDNVVIFVHRNLIGPASS